MEFRIINNSPMDNWNCSNCYNRIISFFRSFRKDRKRKIDAHKSKVIEIFEKWNSDIIKEPSKIFEPLNYTLLDFYISIGEQLRSLDPNGYAREHLKHSSYSDVLLLFNSINDTESKHNTKVLIFFHELSTKLWKDLHQDTGLMESVFLNNRLVNDEYIDVDTKKLYNMEFISPDEGLHTQNLLEYLLNRSTDRSMNEKDLVIRNNKMPMELVYHTMNSRTYLNNAKSIAKASFDTKKLETLKNILMSNEFIEVSKTLKEFDMKVKEIQKLYSDFLFDINKIVDKYPSIDLKGKCEVEREMDFLK